MGVVYEKFFERNSILSIQQQTIQEVKNFIAKLLNYIRKPHMYTSEVQNEKINI